MPLHGGRNCEGGARCPITVYSTPFHESNGPDAAVSGGSDRAASAQVMGWEGVRQTLVLDQLHDENV